MAVVTGASAGIGAAICRALAGEGMKVVGCARRIEKIEELARETKSAKHSIVPYKVCTVSSHISTLYMYICNDDSIRSAI